MPEHDIIPSLAELRAKSKSSDIPSLAELSGETPLPPKVLPVSGNGLSGVGTVLKESASATPSTGFDYGETRTATMPTMGGVTLPGEIPKKHTEPPAIEKLDLTQIPLSHDFSVETQTAAEVAQKIAFRDGTNANVEFNKLLKNIEGGKTNEAKELRDYMTKGPPTDELTFMDRVKEIGTNPMQLIPFLSGASETHEILKLMESANRLDRGIASDRDLLLLKKFSDKGSQNTTFWYDVMNVMAQLPSFAGELFTTGGIYTGVKKATVTSSTKALKQILSEGGKELLEKKLSQIAIKSVGGIAGATAQTIPAGITRITAGTVKNMMPEIELTTDEQEQVSASITKEGDNVLPAATKALGEQWIETLSERSGGLFNNLGRVGKETLIRQGILSSFLKANPTAKVSDFMSGVKRAGYDGIISEMAEERAGEIGRAAIGLEEYKLPTGRQLLVELVSFSIPGLTISGVNKVIERKQTKEGIKQTEKEIEEVMPLTEFEKERAKEEPAEAPIEEKKPPEPLEQPITEATYDFETKDTEKLDKFDYYTKEVEGKTKYFRKEKAVPKKGKVVAENKTEQYRKEWMPLAEKSDIDAINKLRERIEKDVSEGVIIDDAFLRQMELPTAEEIRKGVSGIEAAKEPLKDIESTTKALEEMAKNKPGVIGELVKQEEVKQGGLKTRHQIFTNWFELQYPEYKDKYKLNTFVDGDVYIHVPKTSVHVKEMEMPDLEYLNKRLKKKGISEKEKTEIENEIKILNQAETKAGKILREPQLISEAYHKAKADGSNPELVKAVEEAIGQKPSKAEPTKKEYTRAEKQKGFDLLSDDASVFTNIKEFFSGMLDDDGGKGSSKYYGMEVGDGNVIKLRVSDHFGNLETTGQYTVSIVVDEYLLGDKVQINEGENYTEININPNSKEIKRNINDHISDIITYIENIKVQIPSKAEPTPTIAEEAKEKAGIPKKIPAKEEFKVGDILDPQGKTNMVGQIKIREISGNTIKFIDSKGTEYGGMQRSLVRNLINEGSWKKVAPAEEKIEIPKDVLDLAAKTEPTPTVGETKAQKEYDTELSDIEQQLTDAKKTRQNKLDKINKKVELFGDVAKTTELFGEKQDLSKENIDAQLKPFNDIITNLEKEKRDFVADKDKFLKKYEGQAEIPAVSVTEAEIVKTPILKRINKAFLKIGTTIFDNAEQLMAKARELVGEGASDLRYAIIGEKGASQLDNAQRVLDDLNVAREMEQAGKTPKEIHLATSWEKGVDGKWRYEIPYIETNKGVNKAIFSEAVNASKDLDEFNKKEDYESNRERQINSIEKLYKELGYSLFDKSVQKQISKALSKNNPDLLPPKTLTASIQSMMDIRPDGYALLSDVIQHSDLFKAHPELKNVRVEFGFLKDANAQWNTKTNTIVIDGKLRNDNETIKSALVHEIQHAIQDKEGFAKGGSPQQFEFDKPVLDLINRQRDVETMLENGANKMRRGEELTPQEKEDRKRITDEYYSLEEKVKALPKKLHNRYLKLAGEVEARNVQKRMNLTPAERKAKMLSETEDVAREHQIIIHEALGESNALKQKEEFTAKGGNVLVNKTGEPIKMYKSGDGNFYTPDLELAEKYASSKNKPVASFIIKGKKIFDVNNKSHNEHLFEETGNTVNQDDVFFNNLGDKIDDLRQAGYDVVKNKHQNTHGGSLGKDEYFPIDNKKQVAVHEALEEGKQPRFDITMPDGSKKTVQPINADVVNGFYSPLEKVINETKFDKLPAKQWVDKFGKGEEAKWTGLTDWLNKQQGSVSKADIQQYLKENRIQIVEVVKGDKVIKSEQQRIADELYGKSYEKLSEDEQGDVDSRINETEEGQTKFHQYQLEGEKENYREWLIINPKSDFKDPHWEEKGIVGHMRGSTRVESKGEKVFHISELQSGHGQKGKKEGFKEPITDLPKGFTVRNIGDEYYFQDAQGRDIVDVYNANDFVDAKEKAIQKLNSHQKIPAPAPFVTETTAWVKLLLKHALKIAVEDGATKITWETGETQNARYDLSKQVDKIAYNKATKTLGFWKKSGGLETLKVEPEKLVDYIGKDLAEKILNDKENYREYEGENLKVGGKGMIGFYGSPKEGKLGIVGEVAKKLFKQEPKTTNINSQTAIHTPEFAKWVEKKYPSIGEYDASLFTKAEKVELEKKYLKETGAKLEGEQSTQHSIDITPELKAQVEQGQPLFHYNEKGEILGFAHNGKIYLNGEKITAQTTFEEMGHTFINWAKQTRPDLYQSGLEKVTGSRYLRETEANENYQKEALKLGKKGSNEYNQYMQEEALAKAIADNGAKFVTETKKSQFKEWVRSMWRAIIKEFGIKDATPEQVRKMTLDEFATKAAADVFLKEEVAEKPQEKPIEEKKREQWAEAPTFKEHITTGTKEQAGKYQIEKVEDEIKILNIDSGKYVKPTKQNQWVIDQYIDANIEALRSGKEAEIPEGMTDPIEINREIAENSQNPQEVATAWINSKETKDQGAVTFEEALYETAWGIDPVDFENYVGYGVKDVPHLLNRFKKGGQSMEAIAENMAERLNMSEEEFGAIEQQRKGAGEDLVSRITAALISKEFKDYKPKAETQAEIDLAAKFKELTGLDLTESTAKKVTDYRNMIEKLADSIDKFADEGITDIGLPFIITPRLLKFALHTVAKALRAGSNLARAIKMAIIKTKELMKTGEKFDEKEFRAFMKDKGMDVALIERTGARIGKERAGFQERSIERAEGKWAEEVKKVARENDVLYDKMGIKETFEKVKKEIEDEGGPDKVYDLLFPETLAVTDAPIIQIKRQLSLQHYSMEMVKANEAGDTKTAERMYERVNKLQDAISRTGISSGQASAMLAWRFLGADGTVELTRRKIKAENEKKYSKLTDEQKKEIDGAEGKKKEELLKKRGMLPELTAEQAAKLKQLASIVETQTPGSSFYIKAVTEMGQYINSILPKNKWTDLADSWIALNYAQMLSGISTHIVNLYSSTSNIVSSPLRNITNLSKWYRAVKKGVKEKDFETFMAYNPIVESLYMPIAIARGAKESGKVFAQIMTDGGQMQQKYIEQITGNNNFQISTLEQKRYDNNRYKPLYLQVGNTKIDLNIYNYAKFVGRTLLAEDGMMYNTSYEQELQGLIWDKMRETGLKGKALRNAVLDEYSRKKVDIAEAQKILDKEVADYESILFKGELPLYKKTSAKKLTEREKKIRLSEIIADKVLKNIEATEAERNETKQLARSNIFTDDRYGIIGRTAGLIGTATNYNQLSAIALKPFIFFTKIVGNVTEFMLDATPLYGLARATGFSVTGMANRISKAMGKEGFETAQMGEPKTRAYYEQMGRAWFGTIAFAATAGLLIGTDEDDLIQLTGGYNQEAFRKPGREKITPKYSLIINGVPISYLNIPILAVPLGLIGNYNDALRLNRYKEEELNDRLALAFEAVGHTITMTKDMSFVKGIQDLTQMISDVVSTEAGKLKIIGKEMYKKYIGFAARPLPQNNNMILQIEKLFDPVSYSQKDIKDITIYSLGLQHIYGKPSVDIFGEPKRTYPGENVIPYTHWAKLHDKDYRWKFLTTYNAIPNKTYNRPIKTWNKEKDKYEVRTLEPDEFYNYLTESGKMFSEKLTTYINNQTYIGTEKEIESEVGKLYSNATKEARTKLFLGGASPINATSEETFEEQTIDHP